MATPPPLSTPECLQTRFFDLNSRVAAEFDIYLNFLFLYQLDLSCERLANGNGKVESSDNAHIINIIKFPNSFLKNYCLIKKLCSFLINNSSY